MAEEIASWDSPLRECTSARICVDSVCQNTIKENLQAQRFEGLAQAP